MEPTELIIVLALGFTTMRLYEACKNSGHPWRILWAAPAFSFVYIGLQFVFRYRIDQWGIGVGEGIVGYVLTALVMTASIGVLLAIVIGIDKWRGKRIA